ILKSAIDKPGDGIARVGRHEEPKDDANIHTGFLPGEHRIDQFGQGGIAVAGVIERLVLNEQLSLGALNQLQNVFLKIVRSQQRPHRELAMLVERREVLKRGRSFFGRGNKERSRQKQFGKSQSFMWRRALIRREIVEQVSFKRLRESCMLDNGVPLTVVLHE